MCVQAGHPINPMATVCPMNGWLNSNVEGTYIEKCYIQMEKTF